MKKHPSLPSTLFSEERESSSRRPSVIWPWLIFALLLATLTACVAIQTPKRAHIATAEPSPSASPLAASDDASPIVPTISPESRKPETVLPCPEREGKLENASAESQILGGTMEYVLYLPPCYSESETKQYPALYLFHGQGRDPQQWVTLGLIQTANSEIASGILPPMLIVMPHITAEMTGPAAFVADLLPVVDTRYRTIADRGHRATGGVSRGAEWALRVALGRADLFSAVGLHSLSASEAFWKDVPALSRNVPPGMWPRMYIDIGLSDSMVPQAERLLQILDSEQHPYENFFQPGDHSDAYWAAHIAEYLAWYSQSWK